MRKGQCKFCTSRSCYTRIVTPDLKYDEVACRRHIHELELDANKALNGALRCNESSTGKLYRGDGYPSEDDNNKAEALTRQQALDGMNNLIEPLLESTKELIRILKKEK